jgi:hypothetical protein
MDSLGRAADQLNLAFSKAAPAFQPLVRATADVIDTVANGLVPAFRELAPLIKMNALHLQVMTAGFRGWLQFNQAVMALDPLAGLRRRLVGGAFDEKAGPSVAARPPKFTSAEEIQRDMARNALMASAAAGKEVEPQETTEGWLRKIYEFMSGNLNKKNIVQFLQEMEERRRKREQADRNENLLNLPRNMALALRLAQLGG